MELPDAYHVHISSSLSYHLCLNFPLKYSSAIKKHHDPLDANLLFFFFPPFLPFHYVIWTSSLEYTNTVSAYTAPYMPLYSKAR